MTDEPSEAASRDGLAGILFQRSSDGLLLIDPLTERVLDANPAVERLTDFTRAELLEMSLRSIVRHEQPWHDWALPASKDDGSHEGFLLRTRQADRWVPVRLGMTPIPVSEEQTRVLIRLTDSRAGLALQRRAQKAEAELQRVLNLVSDCLWSARVVPGGLAYRYLSPSVQRLTGQPAALFLDLPTKWAERIVPADRPAWQVFRDRLAAGQPGTLDYRIRHADGRQIRVRESVLVVPDEGGLVLHGVLSEIPDTPKEDLPRPSFSLESFERVLGVVSGEFNDLMTSILGHLSLPRLDPVGESVGTTMSRIEGVANRGIDLCRQLATCAGHGSRRGSTPDPATVIRGAVAEVAATAPKVAFEVLAEPALPAVSLDPMALAQVIEELTRNALQAGAMRVVVRLASKPLDAPRLPSIFAFPRAEMPPTGLHIQVEDDGEGLSDKARQGLGEPFFTTRPGQRGMGLPTVLGIARANQGILCIHSLAGASTIVRIAFPRSQGTRAGGIAGTAPVSEQPLVLVVDDDAAILDVASRLLTSAGCRVLPARNGVDAVALYKQHAAEIRFVLLDLSLPRLSGDRVAAELRRLDAALPIALMSGHHDLESRPELANLGLAGCVQKPFRMAEILALLERVLGLRAKR